MVWVTITPFNTTTTATFGGDATNKISNLFNGVSNVDTVLINSTWKTVATKFSIVDIADNTKTITWDTSGNTTGMSLTLKSQQSTSQILQFPNITATDIILTAGLCTKITKYDGVSLSGKGVATITGIDNRSAITSPDGAAITVYAVPSGAGKLFRITADINATAFTSGTATYTIKWTQNGVVQSLAVTATALNTLSTSTDLINPDASTNITVQLTGTFVATLTIAALVEQFS